MGKFLKKKTENKIWQYGRRKTLIIMRKNSNINFCAAKVSRIMLLWLKNNFFLDLFKKWEIIMCKLTCPSRLELGYFAPSRGENHG